MLFVPSQVLDTGLVGGGFHHQGGELSGVLHSLSSCFQLDIIWAYCLPRSSFVCGVPCGGVVVTILGVPLWCNNI